MLSMDVMLPGRVLFNKLADFIGWLRQERGQDVSPYSGDILYQEVRQIEQTLTDVSTRPSSIVRKLNSSLEPTRPSSIVRKLNSSLEPITEQQRIIDLAG